MPDIGLVELILIGIVAFMVLGPERLPDFFSQIGSFIRQGREWMSELKKQMDHEKSQLMQPIEEAKAAVIEEVRDSTVNEKKA